MEGGSSNAFECCVCWSDVSSCNHRQIHFLPALSSLVELLYKPIVLACGHISCFWCVNKAMHGFRASCCPICRQPYYHLPNICQLLHFFLSKLEPESYKKREMEVLEEERSAGIYSSQFVKEMLSGSFENANESGHDELPNNSHEKTLEQQISVDDVLCSSCKEMLYKPAVLNCGHVYCEACLYGLSGDPLQCNVCQIIHPGEFPNVCLVLDHFLEEEFPTEYAVRREQVLLKRTKYQVVNPLPNATQTQKLKAKIPTEALELWLNEDMYDINVGIGCDSCGMYPIAGKRYRCMDCKEKVGFDLCESCYNTTSKLPGRFNQQHTPDHKFVLDESCKLLNNLMQRANALVISQDGFEEDDVPLAEGQHYYNDGGSEEEEELI